MKKIFLISSFLLSALVADNFLGKPLSNNTLKPHREIKSYSKNIDTQPIQKSSTSHKKFKKDHHRYDKRYSNFNYERDGYYNNDNYYYGYYDDRGYFYNNIYFTYNSQYTYYDRQHHIGYFRPEYHHYRVYEYHVVNDWNRVHCYREANQIVYGYYDNRPSYNHSYHSSYYDNSHQYNNNHYPYYRDNARMNTNRNNYSRDRENYHNNHHSNYDTRYNNRHSQERENEYRRNNNNRYNDRNQYRRGDTRMRTRNSSRSHRHDPEFNHTSRDNSRREGTAHMQLSR